MNKVAPARVNALSHEAKTLAVWDLLEICMDSEPEGIGSSLRFYVKPANQEITIDSVVFFNVIVNDHGNIGVVLFFDKLAADFAKLYVCLFCHPDMDFTMHGWNKWRKQGFEPNYLPPLSDLLGFTKHGTCSNQRISEFVVDLLPIRVLRESHALGPNTTRDEYDANVPNMLLAQFEFTQSFGLSGHRMDSFAIDELTVLAIMKCIAESPEAKGFAQYDLHALKNLVVRYFWSEKKLTAKIVHLVNNRTIPLIIYSYAYDSKDIADRLWGAYFAALALEILYMVIRPHIAKYIRTAALCMKQERREQQQRIEQVISYCVTSAIASVKLSLAKERRAHILEMERQQALEEEARRRERIEAERRARAEQADGRGPRPNVARAPQRPRRPRNRREANPLPPEVAEQLKSASQVAAREHEADLQAQEAARVEELVKKAELRKIGWLIATGQ